MLLSAHLKTYNLFLTTAMNWIIDVNKVRLFLAAGIK